MKLIKTTALCAALMLAVETVRPALAQYPGWAHSGTLTILTTAEGANLPEGAIVDQFPLLVRLDRDWFDFTQAQPHGEDVRFSSGTGEKLAFEIETWNAAGGSASIWVRMPHIAGNARQDLHMHWGRPDAGNESNAQAVFDASNGYLSVWHLGEIVRDEAGTLVSKDVGTTTTEGVIGTARHFSGRQGIFGGDRITNYPFASAPHTTEAWFRAEKPNVTLMGWGNEGGGRGSKVRMQFRSPPHLRVDSDFSDIKGGSRLPLREWIHVVHTYGEGPRRVYINGRLDGEAATRLDIKNPARLWLGGWYHNYDFVGDLDEVRVSKVARSSDWVRLGFENQKPMQTLVGPLVQPGRAFSVTPAELTLPEGGSATLSAEAGGARKIYWILRNEGRETVVAVDRFRFTFAAGRVSGDRSETLLCKAVYGNAVETREIPIRIRENVPEPVFSLKAPARWDGRAPIEVVPEVANLDAMRARGAGQFDLQWNVTPFAVIKQIAPGRLLLTRALNSGALTVTATMNNGGPPVTQSTTIAVREPKQDEWVPRAPDPEEKPEDNQFYARNDRNEGVLFFNGSSGDGADSVFLRVYADEKPYRTERKKLAADQSYAFTVKLKPGLIRYRVEFGTVNAGRETVTHTATNLVCGDAFLIQGQSNAVATDWGKEEPALPSEWIRSFGSMSQDPQGIRGWGEAVPRSRDGEKLQIGYWGMELARHLQENYRMPICIINGAVGGTRVDQHQRNPEKPADLTTIYGRLLWRVQQAHLTHGVRAILWHQGENDQGADGPTGGYGWETYRSLFIELAAAWKRDFPNLQHDYIFQIWPKSCAMGIDGSDNRLREVQRNLPTAFSRMSIMSTLGIEPPGGCHYPAAGYAELARLIGPLIERDHYGKVFHHSITPPDLKRARFTSNRRDTLALEFDQPVQWDNALAGQFQLDDATGQIISGSVAGDVVTLTLAGPATAQTVTYLDSKSWSQKNLLRGVNGIAALTFCRVPIESPARIRGNVTPY